MLEIENMRDGYVDVLRHVVEHGERVAPRGQPTLEVMDGVFRLADPTDALPLGVGRRLNKTIALLEAVQLVAGESASLQQFQRLAPKVLEFAGEPDGFFHGNYGRRIDNQLLEVERKLKADRDTRQAVVTLWNPGLDNTRPTPRDIPCTVALTYSIRQDELRLSVLMRSSDCWLGLAHDVFQFTQTQITLAKALDVGVGPYTHHAVSMHVYERDLDAIGRLRYTTGRRLIPTERLTGFGRGGQGMAERMARAAAILEGRVVPNMTTTEQTYANALA